MKQIQAQSATANRKRVLRRRARQADEQQLPHEGIHAQMVHPTQVGMSQRGRLPREERHALVSNAAEMVGNRQVQRELSASGGTQQHLLQRQDAAAENRQPKRRVPALADSVVNSVEEQILIGNYQNAINLIVAELVSQRKVDLAYIEDGIVKFDSSLEDEGHTQQYWRKTPEGGAQPDPSTVRIGLPAFTSVPWLFTVITHEIHHAQQFQTIVCAPDKQAAHEVDAYLTNIEAAEANGLNLEETLDLWQRLRDDWWIELTNPQIIAIYQPRYDAAEKKIQQRLAQEQQAATKTALALATYRQLRRRGSPVVDQIHKEVDARFWSRTHYKVGKPLNPNLMDDHPYMQIWVEIRNGFVTEWFDKNKGKH